MMTNERQGVRIQELLDAFQSYVVLLTGFPERWVLPWYYPGRPSPEGYDHLVWFRPISSPLDKDAGPSRYGKRIEFALELNLNTRYMADASQRDDRRAELHYLYTWRIIESFTDLNLFRSEDYAAPDPMAEAWTPPVVPSSALGPLTYAPMRLDVLPEDEKAQEEEGTMTSRFTVSLPSVLKLTLPK
jgi:hypothetical protein